jgi:hypothetical protein
MSSTSADLLNTVTHQRATSCRNTAAKHGKHFLDVLVMLADGRPWIPDQA